MSCCACVEASVRIVDIKGFVRDYIKFAGDEVDPDAIKTPRDVFAAAFGELFDNGSEEVLDEGDENQFDDVVPYEGTGVYPTEYCYEGLTDFFTWCIPYVESKTASFFKKIDVWEATGWRKYTSFCVTYAIVDGKLEERYPRIEGDNMEGASLVDAPKVSEMIECLKNRHPEAKLEQDGYVLTFGMFALKSLPPEDCDFLEEGDETGDTDNQGQRVLDMGDAQDEYAEDRMYCTFNLHFTRSPDGKIKVTGFGGDLFDWDNFVVYDKRLTKKKLAEAISAFVTFKA